MKKMMCISVIISAFMLLLPLTVMSENSNIQNEDIQVIAPIEKEETKNDIFRLLDKKSGKITEIVADEYIFGVVAAEIPALYETEALKAQAVAAYTYAHCKRLQNKNKEYDITTDFNTDQSFKSREQAIKDWGEKGEEYALKVQAAVHSVKGQIITYKGQPISAVYHAVSCGNTYSAKDVWGKDVEYLKSVSSSWDKLTDKYITVTELTEAQLKEKLSANSENKKLPVLGTVKTKGNGLVESVEIYGKKVSGSDFREKLGLASRNFTFEKKEGNYIFTCLGYGHGVGMSQNGANQMAKQGYSYTEILSHYYKNTKISK